VHLEADVVVVGSGAGGGVMAGELVKAGLKVIVLEKGGYYTSEDFKKWRESEASKNILERGGLVQSKSGSVAILAGSCVGGGTLVNWSASFRTPKFVLDDWAAEGLSAFGEKGTFHEHMDAVLRMFHVNTRFSYRDDECPDERSCSAECDPLFAVNANNKSLWKGAEAAGFIPERIPRNVKGCVDCGHCGNGCPYNSKQSTITAVLEPLRSTDFLTVIPHCNVTRVVRGTDGYAEGVEGTVHDSSTGATDVPIYVKAKVVVVACGALHTPALLLRSGFKNRKIGKHLALHPVAASAGLTKSTATGLASGVSMGVVVRNSPLLERECDPGFGVALENPPVYLSMLGLVLAWDSGLALKSQALLWRRTLAYLGISRDHSKESNRIELDSRGEFEVHYDLTSDDAANALNGLIQQLRIMRVAPDTAMLTPAHSSFLPFDNSQDDEAFEAYIAEVQREGIRRGKMEIFSAHQMGSCRMAVSPDKGPVSPNGSLFECPNVFVSDASVFPTALGINPMMTIEAIAHMISRDVMRYLKVSPDRLVALPGEW
jgi:long-chain-alcohol oxidase